MVKRLAALRENVTGHDGDLSFLNHSPVPAFILHLRSGGFVDVNQPFSSCFSYSREQLLDGSVRAAELIGEGERDLFRIAQRFPDRLPDERFIVKCTDRVGRSFPGEVSIRACDVDGEQLVYGSVEDISDRADAELELEDQLDAAIQANKQVRTLMDKMRNITGVTSELLTVRHEVGILTRARSILCNRNGMNFEDVEFYKLNQSSEAIKQPFTDEEKDPIPLTESHPAVRIVTGESDFVQQEPDLVFLPLQGSDERFGAMAIRLTSDERSLMEANQHVWKGFRETLSILANLIGLMIHNCRLADRERNASIHDSLTGVYNRRFLNKTLEQEVDRAKRYDYPLSLMIVDADNFKEINDTFGHQEGDRIIQQIARTLEQSSRESDVLCRFGGDEFSLILPSTNGEDAERLAHRIEERFEDATFTVNVQDGAVEEISVRVSIGISTLSELDGGDDPEALDETDLLRIADRSMFQAKESDQTRIQRADAHDRSDSTN
jgi:diguanylate cyclase (GGDEF)-like protein/PAS domain S-box-containing protein